MTDALNATRAAVEEGIIPGKFLRSLKVASMHTFHHPSIGQGHQ